MELASRATMRRSMPPLPFCLRSSSSRHCIHSSRRCLPVLVRSPLSSCCAPPVCVHAASARSFAKKKDSVGQTTVEEGSFGEGDDMEDGEVGEGELVDLVDDEIMDDEEELEDDFDFGTEDDEQDVYVGDGGAGGGISLAGTWWDKEVLSLAKQVSSSFDDDLSIYAFKTTQNSVIQVRIEKLSARYGSPSMDDIESYSVAYRELLDEAEAAGKIPQNTSLEVSSPGVERVVRVPEDLERFKDRPMYVRYLLPVDAGATSVPQDGDGVFTLVSFDVELGRCTWSIADVKINRQLAGKGRPLSNKKKEWRLETPFDSLKLVHLHSDC